jgi:hypothetical protein
MQQAINKNVHQNLPTYKKVLTDHRSRNLDLRSHFLTAVYTSRVESFQLLHMDPPRLGA